jgi:N-acetylmuramoyl-L-alanine amidase
MKVKQFVPLCLLLFLFAPGCITTKKIRSGTEGNQPVTIPAAEIRGFAIFPETWISEDTGIIRKNIITIIQKAAAANYNSIFFQVTGKSEKYLNSGFPKLTAGNDGEKKPLSDPLHIAIDEAHKNQMKIYSLIDISAPDDKELIFPMPEVINRMKKKIQDHVIAYNIGGLSLISGENMPELIEALFVEAMLVKPYLVNSIVYSGENGHKNAANCLKEGIADFIISKSELGDADPARGPVQYSDRVYIPENLKKTTPNQIVCLDLSALFPDKPGGQTIYINNRTKTRITDSEGRVDFISARNDTINIETTKGSFVLPTENWTIPYKYSLMADGRAVRKSPWIEFRNVPKANTDLAEYDFLCKTEYPATVRINGDSVKQYKTGIFFKKILFNEGTNRVRAEAEMHDSLPVIYENEFIYHKTDKTKKPFPLWINERTIEPADNIDLMQEDIVRFSFQGSKGQDGHIEVNPGKIRINCSREDFQDYSIYRGELPLSKLKTGKPGKITVVLIPSAGAPDKKALAVNLKNQVIARAPEDFPFVKIINENSRLTYNLGAPRLGGPIRSELGPGVVMKTNGKIGQNYRICLSRTENGFINQSDVIVMPPGTFKPAYYITSMSCGPSENADVLTIPYPEPVPYEVYPDPDQKRIVITLFGVETSSTWITHLAGRKIIDKITWEQTNPETYRVFVNLNTPEIWGYSVKQEGKRLVIRVKYPPKFELLNGRPLAGLKIAIEAGHGGSGTGAIGLSGLVEKDINLDLSFRLGAVCKAMGAEIVQIRDSDKDMSLFEKRNIAISSKADLLICIHANAGGRGYLQVAGTSTYYNNPFWAPLAEDIYDRLLELKLKEFGVVGSFNYSVIRVSEMPAVLVEQAFMTHAEDEEMLADPQFRQQMAQKIYEGIIDYLKRMKQKD